MSEQIELKPCPFCWNDKVEISWWSDLDDDFGYEEGNAPSDAEWAINCPNCNFTTDGYRSREIVSGIWNTRKTPWIPTSERLPSVNGTYLVTRRNGAVVKRAFLKEFADDWSQHYTAWMPVEPTPEPYQEGK